MSIQTSNIINNILHQSTKNIIYQNHNSFFDLFIKSLDYNFLEPANINTSGLWFNLFISNEPISFSQKEIILSKNLHINSLLFFHGPPQKNFKKEDCIILKNNILSSYKVLTHSELAGAWLPSDDKWHNVEYGIVDPGPIDAELKNKDIIILNINKNQNITQIYKILSEYTKNIYMLDFMPDSIEALYKIIEEYKICIDFENIINSLVAASLNCYCITSYFCPHLDYYTHIKNIEDINSCVSSVIDQIDYNKLNLQKEKILNKFSFDNFNKRLALLLYTITKEKFIL